MIRTTENTSKPLWWIDSYSHFLYIFLWNRRKNDKDLLNYTCMRTGYGDVVYTISNSNWSHRCCVGQCISCRCSHVVSYSLLYLLLSQQNLHNFLISLSTVSKEWFTKVQSIVMNMFKTIALHVKQGNYTTATRGRSRLLKRGFHFGIATSA